MNTNKIIKIYRITSYLLMLGVIHSALTPLFFQSFFSVEALWFFGTGLSLVFLGMLNIACSRLQNNWFFKITLAGNIIGCIFSIIVTFVLKEPQAYISTLFHFFVLFTCFANFRVTKIIE